MCVLSRNTLDPATAEPRRWREHRTEGDPWLGTRCRANDGGLRERWPCCHRLRGCRFAHYRRKSQHEKTPRRTRRRRRLPAFGNGLGAAARSAWTWHGAASPGLDASSAPPPQGLGARTPRARPDGPRALRLALIGRRADPPLAMTIGRDASSPHFPNEGKPAPWPSSGSPATCTSPARRSPSG
ncbi:hypothetical protein VARIO8X_60056 [Burkholderiales bacterium 8X]|nr:hypothetical protein VARIO8X_60056 [Burkholderiales bacterium 8X]